MLVFCLHGRKTEQDDDILHKSVVREGICMSPLSIELFPGKLRRRLICSVGGAILLTLLPLGWWSGHLQKLVLMGAEAVKYGVEIGYW